MLSLQRNDAVEAFEYRFVIQAVSTVGPPGLNEQAHRRVIVDSLATQTRVLDYLTDAIQLWRDPYGLRLGKLLSDPHAPRSAIGRTVLAVRTAGRRLPFHAGIVNPARCRRVAPLTNNPAAAASAHLRRGLRRFDRLVARRASVPLGGPKRSGCPTRLRQRYLKLRETRWPATNADERNAASDRWSLRAVTVTDSDGRNAVSDRWSLRAVTATDATCYIVFFECICTHGIDILYILQKVCSISSASNKKTLFFEKIFSP